MIDSGCTNHMTGDSKLLYDFMEAIQPFMSIMFGGGSKGQVLGLGKVAITNDMHMQMLCLSNPLNTICFLFANWLLLVMIHSLD